MAELNSPQPALPASAALSFREIRSLRAFKDAIESWPAPQLPFPASGQGEWTVPGHCAVSGRDSLFRMDELYSNRSDEGAIHYNWRERLVCDCCELNARQRACIHLFAQLIPAAGTRNVWITEQVTSVFKALAQRCPGLIGSEYLGQEFKSGTVNSSGIRHEDITDCSFADESLNAVLSFDVIEHVPDPGKAFRECARVLEPGGVLLFTVPFLCLDERTRVRARLENGQVIHLMEPQYHGDPVQPDKGVLCFQEFGWDVLQQLRDAGFVDASAIVFESVRFGYLGGPQIVLKAMKKGRGPISSALHKVGRLLRSGLVR